MCLSLFSTFCSFLVSKTCTENVYCFVNKKQIIKIHENKFKKLYKLRLLNHTIQKKNVSFQNQGASNGLCFPTFSLLRHTYTIVFEWHWWLSGKKNPPVHAEDTGSLPGLGRSPGERNGKPTPVFLPGKGHGQRSWRATVHGGHKE